MAAVAAAHTQEAVGQDAASEEGVELVFDELRQVGDGGAFGLGEEGRRLQLHQAVQRGLFRVVALVVGRGAIGRPLGLPAVFTSRRHRPSVRRRSQVGLGRRPNASGA